MSKEKFTMDELDVIGTAPAMFPGMPGTPIYNRPISIKENRDLLFSGQRPMWIPSSSDLKMFCPAIIPDNVARGFIVEANRPDPGTFGGKDFFGVEWEFVPEVNGSMVRPGKPFLENIEDWEEKIVFPDLSQYDWEGCAQRNKDYLEGNLIQLWIMNGMFERLISFMEFEGAAMALIDEDQQEYVHGLFSRLCDFYDELIGYYAKYFHPYSIHFHDDWGSQRAPFFSLDTCREMLVPYMKRVVESCHKRGILFDFHCCGQVELLVPAMIEYGADSWGGQPMNDRKMLVAKYGDRFVFGVPGPEISPEATDEQIEALADQFMADYASNGGRIIMNAATPRGGFSPEGMAAVQKFMNAVYIRSRLAYDAAKA